MNPNPDRYDKIAEVMKNVTNLGKSIRKPTGLQFLQPGQGVAGLPHAVTGSFTVRVLLYGVATILFVGLILLAIDQWVTPIFERSPGDGGYIPVPGTDTSQLYWQSTKDVKDLTIGTDSSGNSYATVIEGQANYSITMDVLINNEFPQNLGKDANGNVISMRSFFVIGPTVLSPVLSVSLDNSTNTIYITVADSNGSPQTVVIDNVPIHTPFRIGISKSTSIMEGYLNGLLVRTRPLKTTTILPSTGNKIFSAANIINNNNVLSTGIKVRNLRFFGYTVPPTEMKGRMGDLSSPKAYLAGL
jgi:hypothetical protein